VAFAMGGAVPLLAGSFISNTKYRLMSIVVTSTLALAGFGALGVKLGCAALLRAAIHVLVGGWIAMLIAYGLMCLLSFDSHF
jgi:VIT1/CCC1 family predicted Fe2+/Mn2+ transporter